MRVITWNIRRAMKDSQVWKLLLELKPDIALLQEVGSIPKEVTKVFDVLSKVATTKTGRPQKFSTAILVKGKIISEISLSSEYEWVNKELKFFKGNFIGCVVQLPNQEPINIVSVYSPAWPVDRAKLKGIDVSPVKLKSNPYVWATEIIWSALKNTISDKEKWIVGGDYNISETFDRVWQKKYGIEFGIRSSGNKEILDRMSDLGFTECLRKYNADEIVPTFKHSSKEIIHQIDHLFVTNDLYSKLKRCSTGDKSVIFDGSLSDHLPIIADFNIPNEEFIKGKMHGNILELIDKAYWKKTEYISPHEYMMKADYPETYTAITELIEKEGYEKEFKGKGCKYVNIGGYKYWVYDTLINRALL